MRMKSHPYGSKSLTGFYLILLLISITFALEMQVGRSNSLLQPLVLRTWSWEGLLGYPWLHMGFLHVLESLITLWIFGRPVAQRLGPVLFGVLYLTASWGAAITHLLFDGRPTIGASGAVMGVLGMYVAICYQQFGRSGPLLVCIWLGLTVGLGFIHYGYAAHMAHVGGFFTGFGLALLFMAWDRIDVDATGAHPEVQQWVGVPA